MHRHKVDETKSRSFVKAVLGRIIEIGIGTLVFGIILYTLGFPSPFELGFGLNLLEESICFGVSYFNERIWNKIPWGRKVKDIDNTRSF